MRNIQLHIGQPKTGSGGEVVYAPAFKTSAEGPL